MPLPLLAIAFQLQIAALASRPPAPPRTVPADSARLVARARDVQATFERRRIHLLPWSQGSSDRCDARIGRFCWWYDESITSVPREPEAIGRRRAELLAELDTLGERLPGDRWIAGLRVRYAVEAGDTARAGDVARRCAADAASCAVMSAYVAQARGDWIAADSTYAEALALMPEEQRCAWRDIRALLPGDARDRYEHASCEEREAIESRYWAVSTPRLAARANEWRVEFFGRRFVADLLRTAVTPYHMSWGDDVAEMNLRYGWPVGWSRIQPPVSLGGAEAAVIGHDPIPSFPFAPAEELLDSTAAGGDGAWNFADRGAVSRAALPALRRIVPAHAQVARFARGDSTLIVAAFGASHDSLATPRATLGAVLPDGRIVATPSDSAGAHEHILQLTVPGTPALAGVELADTATGTLARSRAVYPQRADSSRRALSDLLLFTSRDDPQPVLDSALATAIAGDAVRLDSPLGVYWETYGVSDAGDQANTEVTVEQIDQGFFHRARQRVGLADPDSPLHVRWTDARTGVNGVASRAIALDLSRLAPGRYRVTLSLTAPGGAPAESVREIELIDR